MLRMSCAAAGAPPMPSTEKSTSTAPAFSNTSAPLDRAHFHDAFVHAHFMDYELAGDRRGAAHQPIGLSASVPDRHIAGCNGRSFGDGAGPWVVDFERADLVVGGVGG